MAIRLEESWLNVLRDEFQSTYFLALKTFLQQEKETGRTIYPNGNQIFAALDRTPFTNVKVVIIGQDPYHGAGQAHGLCFSVAGNTPHPPSLINIFKELQADLGIPYPKNGDLCKWADQGVLLLNATLTVRAGEAGSHQNRGWEAFTDAIIRHLNKERQQLVFMLWGSYAKAKGKDIDRSRHLVLEAVHPSPLSANRGGWFGNRHFSQCNEFLKNCGKEPINWNLES